MRQEGLTKTMLTVSAVAANRIVRFSAENTAVAASAATDKLVGISDNVGGDANDTVDVILDGIALVKLGGTVAFGDLVTSDATGQGVATTTAGNRVIGVAMQGGVTGDLIGVKLSPHLI